MEIVNRFCTREECARFAQFLVSLVRRGRSASTARSYKSDWQDLALWFRRARGRPYDSSSLDAEAVGEWRAHALKKGRSGATVTRRAAFSRTYGSWLVERGVIDADTIADIRMRTRLKRIDRGPRVLTDEDVHGLLRQVEMRGCRRDQAILYALLDTGMKVSELVTLELGDVDFGRGLLDIRTSRPRQVPLPTRAARKLAWSLVERGLLELPPDGELVLPASGGWPPDHMVEPPEPGRLPSVRPVPVSPMPFGVTGPPSTWPLFVGERGRLTANAVQRVVRKHSTFARVEASPQVLRHTFAYAFWARTQDLVTLAEILGHESIESTRMYTRVIPPVAPAAIVEAEDAARA
jgi:site-specific recombinase XerD